MDRPRSKGEKTKALIAEKAKVIFEQKGYVGTSMEDIREFSEISKGSIYYHFKNKEELFLYTVEKNFGNLADRLGRTFEKGRNFN